MFNSEYSPDNYNSLKISIGAIIKNQKILRSVPDHLKPKKIKKMWKQAAKKLPFLIRYVPDWCKTQEMCDRVVSKDLFMLKSCLDRYKTQKMYDKAVNDRLTSLKFIPDW